MRLASYIAAELEPRFARPAGTRGLVSELRRARFSRTASAAILRTRIAETRDMARYLDPESVARGGMAATEELLYGAARGWSFGLFSLREQGSADTWSRRLHLQEQHARVAASIVRSMARNGDSGPLRTAIAFLRSEELAQMFDVAAGRQSWPEPREPGIYRREHASVLVQSDECRIVVDPVCLSPTVPLASTVAPDPRVDAILITHSHDDHWHIPSILAVAQTHDTPVVVPRVPRTTLLCPDMGVQLAAVEQNCLQPRWRAVLRFGDVEVDVLPFFGEQPAVDAQCPDPAVRNWGNCYRINTPRFSALLLADSGVDPAGSMLDVVAESVAARGPIDVVLACMRDFRSPFEVGGLSTYWMTLPFEELERLYARYEAGLLPSTTAGLEDGGLAKICATARAGVFAGYAQGFAGIGKPIPAGQWGPSPELSEMQALTELAHQLERAGIPTAVQPWNPGDALVPVDDAPGLVWRTAEALG